MKGHVAWVNELTIKDGALETFKELMEEELLQLTQTESLRRQHLLDPLDRPCTIRTSSSCLVSHGDHQPQ